MHRFPFVLYPMASVTVQQALPCPLQPERPRCPLTWHWVTVWCCPWAMLGLDLGQGQPGWTLPVPCSSPANCLTSRALQHWDLAPRLIQSQGVSIEVFSLEFYGFSVCSPRAEAQAQIPGVAKSHLHHCSKHCNPAMIYQLGDWKNCFLPSFKNFRICSAHFLIFHTGLSNN